MTTPASSRRLFGILDRGIERLTRAVDWVAALACAFLITATTFAVIIYQQGIAIVWLDDVLRMLLIWLVYLGAVSLCFHGDHVTMDVIYLRLPPKARRALDIGIALLGIVLCAFITKIGYDSMLRQIAYETLLPSGLIPAWPQSLAIPLCFALMTVANISYLYSVLTGRRHKPDYTSAPAEGL